MLWRCPACRGELVADAARVRVSSAALYETVSGIPELRIDAPAWIDCNEDREHARRIVAGDVEPFTIVAGNPARLSRRVETTGRPPDHELAEFMQ